MSGSQGGYPYPDDPSKVRHWNGQEWGERARFPKSHVVVKVMTIILGILGIAMALFTLWFLFALMSWGGPPA